MPLHCDKHADARLAKLLRRCEDSTVVEVAKPGQQHGTQVQTLAVTNRLELARELQDTQKFIHNKEASVPLASEEQWERRIPSWKELEPLCRELHALYERADDTALTSHEKEYMSALTRAIVDCLAHACLNTLEIEDVRVRLLEVAVRPTPQWRKIALTLLLNTTIGVLSTLLATQQDTSLLQAPKLEKTLFTVLREMLGKAVVMAAAIDAELPPLPSSSDSTQGSVAGWIELAVDSIVFFTQKPDGSFRSDRLRELDEVTLLFLLSEATNREPPGSELQQKVLTLVVASMYASGTAVSHGTIAAGERQQSTDMSDSAWSTGGCLPLVTVERLVGLELLRFHLYNSPVMSSQKLMRMVLFDLMGDQLRRRGNNVDDVAARELEQLWHALEGWESSPGSSCLPLLSPYVPAGRLAKKLATSCPQVPEKELQALLHQFRQLAQVDEYFGPSASLATAIKIANKQQEKSLSAAETLINRVTELLASNLVVERFRGERWLAELLSYGQDDVLGASYGTDTSTMATRVHSQPETCLRRPTKGSSQAATNNVSTEDDELEETFCFDEKADFRLAAQAKFWELASGETSVSLRVSFARVLNLYVQRRRYQVGKLDASVVQEINSCLHVLLEHQERDPEVLSSVMLLILKASECELSYLDHRWQQHEHESCQTDVVPPAELHSSRIAWSDSLAARILNGKSALDKALIQQFEPEFFLTTLSVLHESSSPHPPLECRRLCCGAGTSLHQDIAACTALILSYALASGEGADALQRAGGLSALAPFLQSCDTRVAVFMAKVLREKAKQEDPAQYDAFMRELYVACVETDDERALYNSLLHAQTLLHSVSSPST